MQIKDEPYEDFTILHLRGEFDTFYCPMLQKEVDGLIAAGVSRIALNLRLVKFINSTALGAIIKASRVLGQEDGKLVLSRPSPFCRDIMEKVGLDRVVPIYDTDEEAGAALVEDRAVSTREDAALEDETAILFSPRDPRPTWSGVGRMSALDAEGLHFTWNGGKTGLTPFEIGQRLCLGTELNIKFRLPLLQKGHCEAVVTVNELEERPDGVKLAVSFSELEPDTRQAVQQYDRDMRYLKRVLPPGGPRPDRDDDEPGATGIFARLKPPPFLDSGHAVPELPVEDEDEEGDG